MSTVEVKEKFNVMLASPVEEAKLKFPLIASPKFDGGRGFIKDGQLLARSNKKWANKHVNDFFSHPDLDGLDGELVVGPPGHKDVFLNTMRGLRSTIGKCGAVLYVFDCFDLEAPYHERVQYLRTRISKLQDRWKNKVLVVEQRTIVTSAELLVFETEMLEAGFEGLIVRDPTAPYMNGRSNVSDGGMLKLKRFKDSECMILGMIEMMSNDNPEFTNEFGEQEKQKLKEGMNGLDMMGAMIVRDLVTGKIFGIGTGKGMSHEMRREYWKNRGCTIPNPLNSSTPCWSPNLKLSEEIQKYQYQDVGNYELPRFPSWIGVRAPEDMS